MLITANYIHTNTPFTAWSLIIPCSQMRFTLINVIVFVKENTQYNIVILLILLAKLYNNYNVYILNNIYNQCTPTRVVSTRVRGRCMIQRSR